MKINSNKSNKTLGLLFIIIGCIILILTAGELLVRLTIALGAIMLINYGMRLCDMQPAQQMIMRAWFNRSRW